MSQFHLKTSTKCEHNNPHTFVIHSVDDRGHYRYVCPTCLKFMGYGPVESNAGRPAMPSSPVVVK